MQVRPDFPRAKPGEFHGDWRCLSDDPVTGIAEWVWFETAPDGTIERIHTKKIQHHSDLLLAQNKALYNDSQGKRWGDGKVVASIPLPIYESLLGEAAANKDRKFIRKFLNDPDNRKFRTFEGKL